MKLFPEELQFCEVEFINFLISSKMPLDPSLLNRYRGEPGQEHLVQLDEYPVHPEKNRVSPYPKFLSKSLLSPGK